MSATQIHRLTVGEAVSLLCKAGFHPDHTPAQLRAIAESRLTKPEMFKLPAALQVAIAEVERLAATAPGSAAHVALLNQFGGDLEL